MGPKLGQVQCLAGSDGGRYFDPEKYQTSMLRVDEKRQCLITSPIRIDLESQLLTSPTLVQPSINQSRLENT